MTKDEQEQVKFQISEIEQHMKEDDFQYEFFHSLKDQYENTWRRLTEKQIESLNKIYERVTNG